MLEILSELEEAVEETSWETTNIYGRATAEG